MGRDSDDELALGEVGRCGVAVDTLADVEDLYRGIDLGAVTTSMTINGPAAVIFAMYVANAEATGVERARLGGTLQNDILKEYQAQKEFIFPPRPSLRLVADTIRFCTAEMPRFHPLSISGYHIREAGSTAAEELAFTVANGFAYVELGLHGRARRRRVRAALVVLLQRAHRLLRGDRQVPRRAPDLGALAARALRRREPNARCRCGSTRRPAGVSLTAQQPEVNIVRTAIEALAGVLGGTQSLHTNSMDETFALPTEKAGAHRAAHATGDRATRRGSPTSPTRSAARGTSRHSPTSSSARPRRSSRASTSSARVRCSTAPYAAWRRAGSSRRSPTPPTSWSAS